MTNTLRLQTLIFIAVFWQGHHLDINLENICFWIAGQTGAPRGNPFMQTPLLCNQINACVIGICWVCLHLEVSLYSLRTAVEFCMVQ